MTTDYRLLDYIQVYCHYAKYATCSLQSIATYVQFVMYTVCTEQY